MTSAAPDERARPDRCPGVLALHEAADGWLARVRLPGGRLTAGALRALAAAAEELGNGLVDLTARANVQLRGLSDSAGRELATRLQIAGLLPSLSHDRARNVLASPLAGRAPGALDDIDGLVKRLDGRICGSGALSDLPGRFYFLVDDGSGAGREIGPDVSVLARGGGRFGVALAGQPLDFESDGPAAIDLAADAAEAFVALRGDAWRLSETPGGARSVATAIGLALAPIIPHARTRTFGPGVVSQRDGRVALTALAPLGQLWPELLRELARQSDDVRVSTRRTVTIVDLDAGAAAPTCTRLEQAGLILDATSGWVGLTACAGAGACPRALADVRAAAAQRAVTRSPRDRPEHWAACERRCGEMPGTPVAVTVRAVGDVSVRCDGEDWSVPSLEHASKRLALEAAR